MSHLYSYHSQLPKGICIDFSIENHERCQVQSKTDVLRDIGALHSGNDVCTVIQEHSSGKSQHAEHVMNNKNCISTKKLGVIEADNRNADLNSDVDFMTISDIDVEPSSPSLHLSDSSSAFLSDNTAKDSASPSVAKSSQRKSRKLSHVVNSNGSPHGSDLYWVEIVAATKPMTAQCSHCSFTCNTELQLKVLFLCNVQLMSVS